jgi:FkbM family methyltransferase
MSEQSVTDLEIDRVLAKLEQQSDVVFVQIGAYIGDTENDPIARTLRANLTRFEKSRAVLVEPVKQYFDQLTVNYADLPGIQFVHAAIAEADGETTIYRLGVDPVEYGQPDWLRQCSSTREDRMTELWDNCESERDYQEAKAFWHEHAVGETVPAMRVDTLLDTYGLSHVDFFQIDTEGSDYDILRTVDFNRIRPTYINYENELLGKDEQACRDMIIAAGYELFDWDVNTLACRTD